MWLTPGKPPFYPLDHAHLFLFGVLSCFFWLLEGWAFQGLRFFIGQVWSGTPYQGVG